MRSSSAILVAVASTVVAQPHGHQHAHLHPARHEHQHIHDKRVLETEIVVEWVTETVVEMIDSTTTTWITPGVSRTSTTLATVVASASSDAGQFFEGASSYSTQPAATSTTPPAVAQPVVTSSSASAYVAPPAPEPTTTTSAYVAPVVTPTTVAPVAVTSTTAEAPAPAASTSASTSGTVTTGDGTTYEGKITYIGSTVGAYGSCGQPYTDGSMFVAVNPAILDCFSPMWITANGRTVKAVAADKCMGCTKDHIDVADDVYTALGYDYYNDPSDGGMHDNPGLTWTIQKVA